MRHKVLKLKAVASRVHSAATLPIVNGAEKLGHWGGGMVDHRECGSWLGRESWRQNHWMGAGHGVERVNGRWVRLELGERRCPGCA